MGRNALTEKIPEYLQPYIAQQDPSLYTAIDHESWRFILKIAREFFAEHAHQKYLDGLSETGISSERIPLISEMDEKLRKFNWRAVAVSGFIPPAAFMEFLSLGVLPIACDMRKLENIAYTPAPDIVHEAAGHAPIIADPAFADYLRHYGVVAGKAIYSKQDLDVYLAVRHLSIVKEDPHASETEVTSAQKRLDDALAAVDHVSEATQLGRMGWWTFEYGLIGEMSNPKIYGAGLLSSVGESYHCLGPDVKKITFSMECIEVHFDITQPQPQLFVAKDFATLTRALDDLGRQMAFSQGGKIGLEKAKKAAATTTTQYDSGVQVSGVLSGYLTDGEGEPCYLQFTGPSQVSFESQQLPGQGADYHREGYGSPVGKLMGGKSSAELTVSELRTGRLEFASGVVVEGRLVDRVQRNGQNLLLIFEDCTVRMGEKILFQPAWGRYDMACGTKIISVFGHAADRASYLAVTGGFQQEPGQHKTNLTEATRPLNDLYARVRKLRETGTASVADLTRIHEILERDHRDDWLLRYSLLELNHAFKLQAPWESAVRERLNEIAKSSPEKAKLIARGLELL